MYSNKTETRVLHYYTFLPFFPFCFCCCFCISASIYWVMPAQKWQQYSMQGCIENLRRNKLYRRSQCFNFLGGSFSDRDNASKSPNPIWKRQPQHLKRWFFLKIRPIIFHINITSVIRLVKQKRFSIIEINKPLSAPAHIVS